MKEPKYKINQVLKEEDTDDLKFKIIFISPKIDFDNDYTYFMEVEQDNGDIWYVSYEESRLDEWFEVI